MIIVGDIGNTETKICLVNSNKKIIKRINLNTKKINSSILKKKLFALQEKSKKITKCLFSVLYQVHLRKFKIFF